MEEIGSVYGYARVSASDQNLDRQIDALLEFGVDSSRLFMDKASGKDFNRPAYKRLMKKLCPGDTVVIKSIDRLGRDYEEILLEWRRITKEKQAAFVVLDMPLLDTRSPEGGITGVLISDLVLQLLSYVAQVERDNIKQRQAEGIAAAKARGVKFGRPKIPIADNFEDVLDDYERGDITRRQAAERLGVGLSTFDNWRNPGR